MDRTTTKAVATLAAHAREAAKVRPFLGVAPNRAAASDAGVDWATWDHFWGIAARRLDGEHQGMKNAPGALSRQRAERFASDPSGKITELTLALLARRPEAHKETNPAREIRRDPLFDISRVAPLVSRDAVTGKIAADYRSDRVYEGVRPANEPRADAAIYSWDAEDVGSGP